MSSGPAPPPIQISTEAAPAGGWAQIKTFAAKPMAIAKGHVIVMLDPLVFGSNPVAGLFAANPSLARDSRHPPR